jgi:hypothetical protein
MPARRPSENAPSTHSGEYELEEKGRGVAASALQEGLVDSSLPQKLISLLIPPSVRLLLPVRLRRRKVPADHFYRLRSKRRRRALDKGMAPQVLTPPGPGPQKRGNTANTTRVP